MKFIELSQNKTAIVDDNITILLLLAGDDWYAKKVPHTSDYIAVRCLKINNRYKLQSLAEFISGSSNIEYIDGNTLNNQKNNLRILNDEIDERN